MLSNRVPLKHDKSLVIDQLCPNPLVLCLTAAGRLDEDTPSVSLAFKNCFRLASLIGAVSVQLATSARAVPQHLPRW